MQSPISGKPQLNRKINASLVFGMIKQEGRMSRADLAKKTGMQRASISAIVQDLIDQNFIRVIGPGKSTGGRQPMLLQVNPDGLFAAGLEITEDSINGVIVNLAGKTISTNAMPLKRTDVESVINHCENLLVKLCTPLRKEILDLSVVGVAIPGILERDGGEVVLSYALGWSDAPFQDRLRNRLGLEVYVMNNAVAGAMTEFCDPQHNNLRSLLYVLVNLRHGKQEITSLGSGIVLEGRPYFGEGSMAGELCVAIEHPMAAAKRFYRTPTDLDTLISESLDQPRAFGKIWDPFADRLAGVVASGMDFLSPGRVVIGSDVENLEDLIGKRLRKVVQEKTVAGTLAVVRNEVDLHGITLSFSATQDESLARGAILSRLQEHSLAPVLQ